MWGEETKDQPLAPDTKVMFCITNTVSKLGLIFEFLEFDVTLVKHFSAF